ncbi:hypothetical protein D3Z36_03620 [Lachnospiraceae bacterium]|nr:hypothetical protein [Lachnospiraceae bacterium]
MKLKYYLRGLGIGIICTAIIMGIALSGNKKGTLTDAEIIERARLLGMVMAEETKESEDLGSSEGKNPINEKKKEGEDKENIIKSDEVNNKVTEADINQQDKSSQENKEDPEKKPENENKGQSEGNAQNQSDNTQEIIQIEIKTGEYSDVVCRKLFQAGLISDAEAFNQYLTQKGADDSLRVGVYQIPKGATQDEIIQILQEKE